MLNGRMHHDEAARFVEKVGWAPRFGQGDLTEAEAGESLLDHETFLETKLDDKFFGGKSCCWFMKMGFEGCAYLKRLVS